jgi:SAM-dependent methyltransferase
MHPTFLTHSIEAVNDERGAMDGLTMDMDAFDRFEAAGWQRRAHGYDRHLASITDRVAGALLDAAGVGPGARVLDLGCGPGHVAAACAARGADVTGVDVAEEMLALASRRYPQIRFQRADAQALPFPAASVRSVIGNFVILHVGRPERVAAEAVRVLSPGGAFALSTWDVPAHCRLLGVLTDAVREAGATPPLGLPEGPPFFRFADESEFANLLTDAGLTDVRVRTVAFHHRARTAAELWNGLIDSTVRSRALVVGQPAAIQERIRAAFDRLAGAYATPDGLDIPVSVKIASGVRA